MNTNHMWYERPAERWKESIPIGNGKLGGMVFGTVSEEKICLNEESIWDNPVKDYYNPKAGETMPEVQRLLFEGELAKAKELVRKNIVSTPAKFGAFLPFGDLIISESDLTHAGEAVVPKYVDYTNYKRTLDFETGIVTVTYEKASVKYYREYFASYVDDVIAIRFWNDGPAALDYEIKFQIGNDNCSRCSESSSTVLYHKNKLENDGVSYTGALKAVANTGQARTNKFISDAGYIQPAMDIVYTNDFVLYVSITTDYHGNDPEACYKIVEAAEKKGYEKIKEDHIKDFSSHYNRFSLKIGEDSSEDISIAKWLDMVRQGNISPKFAELYMNYTRYLLLCDSRPGSLPANMQGVWNDLKKPVGESDYHVNVNTQMNYWTNQAWGLASCDEPLVDWMEELVEPGRIAAKRYYNANGWMIHHCTNIFGYVDVNFDEVGLWPMGSVWLSRHLYEMWEYNRDYEQMRKRYYPLMRGAVEFVLDFLMEAPEGSGCEGYLVTNPSVSPENEYYAPDGSHGMLTYGCTMDIQLLQDLFENMQVFIDEIKLREPSFEEPLEETMKDAAKRLPPVRISEDKGSIMEWIEDYKEVDPGHRHMSHLYGLYPGKSISMEKTPELCAAAIKTIDRKYEHGYDGQGWCMGWQAAILARLCEGDRGYEVLKEDFRRHILPNLMINSHGFPQAVDAYGIPAAMLEMLVQSHEGRIHILPSLPREWPKGCVKGLCVRGKHRIDMEWEKGTLINAVVYHDVDSKNMPIVVENEELYRIVTNDLKTEIVMM